jgi:hypothetical protein
MRPMLIANYVDRAARHAMLGLEWGVWQALGVASRFATLANQADVR